MTKSKRNRARKYYIEIPSNRSAGFQKNFILGLGSLLGYSAALDRRAKYKAKLTNNGLRGDALKLGLDMRKVIEREKRVEKASRQEAS